MSKLTSLDIQIPNRISVSFDNRTDKFVIGKRTDGSLKIEHNRKVMKNLHSIRDILNRIAESVGNKPDEKPDFREKDRVKVLLENGLYENTFVCAEPILNYEGKWVVPCFIYGMGTQYIESQHIKLVRRIQ